MAAKAMRTALISKKFWKPEDLSNEKMIGNILNRLGYRLRRIQKANPLKDDNFNDDTLLYQFLQYNETSEAQS